MNRTEQKLYLGKTQQNTNDNSQM